MIPPAVQTSRIDDAATDSWEYGSSAEAEGGAPGPFRALFRRGRMWPLLPPATDDAAAAGRELEADGGRPSRTHRTATATAARVACRGRPSESAILATRSTSAASCVVTENDDDEGASAEFKEASEADDTQHGGSALIGAADGSDAARSPVLPSPPTGAGVGATTASGIAARSSDMARPQNLGRTSASPLPSLSTAPPAAPSRRRTE